MTYSPYNQGSPAATLVANSFPDECKESVPIMTYSPCNQGSPAATLVANSFPDECKESVPIMTYSPCNQGPPAATLAISQDPSIRRFFPGNRIFVSYVPAKPGWRRNLKEEKEEPCWWGPKCKRKTYAVTIITHKPIILTPVLVISPHKSIILTPVLVGVETLKKRKEPCWWGPKCKKKDICRYNHHPQTHNTHPRPGYQPQQIHNTHSRPGYQPQQIHNTHSRPGYQPPQIHNTHPRPGYQPQQIHNTKGKRDHHNYHAKGKRDHRDYRAKGKRNNNRRTHGNRDKGKHYRNHSRGGKHCERNRNHFGHPPLSQGTRQDKRPTLFPSRQDKRPTLSLLARTNDQRFSLLARTNDQLFSLLIIMFLAEVLRACTTTDKPALHTRHWPRRRPRCLSRTLKSREAVQRPSPSK